MLLGHQSHQPAPDGLEQRRPAPMRATAKEIFEVLHPPGSGERNPVENLDFIIRST